MGSLFLTVCVSFAYNKVTNKNVSNLKVCKLGDLDGVLRTKKRD